MAATSRVKGQRSKASCTLTTTEESSVVNPPSAGKGGWSKEIKKTKETKYKYLEGAIAKKWRGF